MILPDHKGVKMKGIKNRKIIARIIYGENVECYSWYILNEYSLRVAIESIDNFKTYEGAVDNFKRFAKLNNITNYKISGVRK